MSVFRLFCPAWFCGAVFALISCSSITHAGDASSASTVDGSLSLNDALQAALTRHPQMFAAHSAREAARQRLRASGRLPDPELTFGLVNLPTDDPDPFSRQAERMTMATLGVEQGIPNLTRRKAQRMQASARVDTADADLELTRRQISLTTGLAWLDLWEADRGLAIVEAQTQQAQDQLAAARIALESDRGSLAGLKRNEYARALLENQQAEWRAKQISAQSQLARWIGLVPPQGVADLPDRSPLPSLTDARARLAAHPRLALARDSKQLASADVQLAQADYRPDWRIQANYGHRRPYADMATITVGVDLPVFPRNRQDPALAAARAEDLREQARLDDTLTQLQADLEDAYARHAAFGERLARYDDVILPAAQTTAEAALADYRSGTGDLQSVLDARARLLELELERLSVQAGQQRSRLQLDYLLVEPESVSPESVEPTGETP